MRFQQIEVSTAEQVDIGHFKEDKSI